MELLLSIAVLLVGGQADCVMKEDSIETPAFHPDLAPCDYHLFGKLKESLQDDDSLVNAAKLWLRRAGPDFYLAGIQALVPRWRKAVERDEDYVEK
ncbi:hypothetical protein C0J52_13259 [Blattella germanica]|nr:hypothetical protein C0J52_13259 [Blattella germanica]